MASAMNRGLLRVLTCCKILFSLSVCRLRYSPEPHRCHSMADFQRIFIKSYASNAGPQFVALAYARSLVGSPYATYS